MIPEDPTEEQLDRSLNELLKYRQKIPVSILEKNPRVLTIEQDSKVASRVFCPSSCRPFEAYALSSNGVFELARIERNLSSICNEMVNVYRTGFRY